MLSVSKTMPSHFQNNSFQSKTNQADKPSVSFGSVSLETQIMDRVGLVGNPFFFNGSGSCGCIRIMAANKLTEAIDAFAKQGNEIVPPDKKLIEMIKKIAVSPHQDILNKGDYNEFCLTKTWNAVSDAIKMHMKVFHLPANEQKNFLEKSAESLEKTYLS